MRGMAGWKRAMGRCAGALGGFLAVATAGEGPYADGSERYPKAPAPLEAGPAAAISAPAAGPASGAASGAASPTSPGVLRKAGARAILKVTPSASVVDRYRILTVSVGLSTPFGNPYDPDDIRLDLRVSGPGGEAAIMPGFHRAGASGNSTWEFRFAPRRVGAYTAVVVVGRQGATEESEPFAFESREAGLDGFLRMDSASWHALRFDSGKRFRGVGENFGWESDKYKFANMLPLLKSHKVNFIRTWEGPGRFGLEHNMPFGRFNPAVADKVDTVMQLAEQHGIHVMSALDPHIYYYTKPDYWAPGIIRWSENPYSTGKGGPCARPVDFFAKPEAKAQYKKRLRYAVARWSAHRHLAVWEFWNEVDHLVAGEGVSTALLGEWHREMSAYLKSIDPYGHIVTTSLSHNDYREIWSLPGIEFTQRHLYGSSDGVGSTFAQYENAYRKPFVSGEFSLHWTGTNAAPPAAFERELHLAMWRGMFQATPILPMTWWWDFHADQGDYVHFARAADMVERMTEGEGRLEKQPLQAPGELEAMALKGPLGAFVWVRNRQSQAVNNASVTLTAMRDLTHDARSYDPWNGGFAPPQPLSPSGGNLRIPLPSLAADRSLAFWLSARVPVAADDAGRDGPSRFAGLHREGGGLRIALARPSAGPLRVLFSDLSGRVLLERTVDPGPGAADARVELPAGAKGILGVTVRGGNGVLRGRVLAD